MPDEARHILGLDHAVFNQLGAADDALQRRFELVRYICRKFAACLLGGLTLGDVKAQKHRADGLAAGVDAADVKLIDTPGKLGARFAVSGVLRAGNCLRNVQTPVEREKILPYAAVFRAEELSGSGVDAQNRALVVKQDKPLGHTLRDVGEFVGFALQLQKLIVNLAVLALDAAQKGRDLVVGVCIERVVQIDGVERLDDAAGKAPGKKRAENYGGKRNNQNRLEHAQKQDRQRLAQNADAKHCAVRQALCHVDRLFQKRLRIARAFAFAGG